MVAWEMKLHITDSPLLQCIVYMYNIIKENVHRFNVNGHCSPMHYQYVQYLQSYSDHSMLKPEVDVD